MSLPLPQLNYFLSEVHNQWYCLWGLVCTDFMPYLHHKHFIFKIILFQSLEGNCCRDCAEQFVGLIFLYLFYSSSSCFRN